MANGKLNLQYRDFDGEKSTVQIKGAVVADAAAGTTLMAAVKTAIDGITVGVAAKSQYIMSEETLSLDKAALRWAQRETKWLVSVLDAVVVKPFHFEIPTADLALLDDTSPDPLTRRSLDLTAGAGLALKTAIEAFMVSPYGNVITVESVRQVGRNT